MAKNEYDTEYETGQDNVEVLGLDVHNPVFVISAVLILSFVIGTLAFPQTAGDLLNGAKTWTMETFDWFYVVAANIVLIFCLALAVSPLGKLRLGGTNAKPEFSRASWIAMLFAAGIGIGLMFYGVVEPMAYYTDWYGTPLNAAPNTPQAERLAFSATLFHWGITPWAIYAVIGLALSFFAFSKGLPLSIRSTFYPLLGERIWGWPGHIIDLLAVVSTLFGLATSLGLGVTQISGGLNFLFGIKPTVWVQIGLIAGITSIAIYSVIQGLDNGVKVLSQINSVMAAALLLFVFIAGPGILYLLFHMGENTLHYVVDSVQLSNWIGRDDQEWYRGWTVFYWAWWISWSPFVGMFIARISKGRTVRDFLLTVMFVPLLITIAWFSTFGETALYQIKNNIGSLPGGITDVSLPLFQMLENLPFSEIVSVLAVCLIIIFFVTSSDSGSLVIDSITAGGKLHAPTPQRIFWASMEGLVAASLLYGGGAAALTSLQSGAITAALPFTFVLLACCVSLYLGLMDEYRFLKQST